MLRVFTAFASGLLFGLGLTVSHMIDPAKVIGFLDIAGDWDPSLAFVMLGALAAAAPGYAVAKRMRGPLYADDFASPARTEVDRRLVVGALLFGTGWGLVGYCPGPALASVGLAGNGTLLFVVSMLAGMTAYTVFDRSRGTVPGR